MIIDFLLERFRASDSKDVVVWRDRAFSYGWLLEAVERWSERLREEKLPEGAVVSLEADFSPNAIAVMLALIEHRCVIVPLTSSVEVQKPAFRAIAEVEQRIEIDEQDQAAFHDHSTVARHEILRRLRQEAHPGLVLFSSGSSGKPKAAVHDFVALLEKFKVPRHSKRTMAFMLFDHIGGVNTLLYVLSNAGCVVTVPMRTPDVVCEAIEKYKVQILPTSPTFINLLLLSEAYRRYNLSSLELVTYGTEVMQESTLKRFHQLFPDVRLQQTYGLSEVGILRSKSKSSDSLWVKVGGEGFETRVVDGTLQIKARSAMLGYLNHPTPFTEDGWFKTGDAVEVDGEYIRILGRQSDLINVGGEKVFPAEVESVVLTMEGVEDVAVRGVPSPITGQMIEARVKLGRAESLREFQKRMRIYCRDKLARYKIPQKTVLVDEAMHGERFKKMRNA